MKNQNFEKKAQRYSLDEPLCKNWILYVKKLSRQAKDSNYKENRGKNSKTAEKSKNSYKIAKN